MAPGESSGTATILFTDLVASTAIRARLGEDAAEALRRTHDRLVNAAIESKGGNVVKHLGDGVMATFASAADALSAAVAAEQALARHNRSGAAVERLEIRVGLAAGDVVFEDADVFGTPVIEASRLCGAARGGQVLASEVVRLLAGSRGGHRFTPVGALELKGLPDPVAAVEVGWDVEAAAVPLPAALARPGSFRFVGREAEAEVIARLAKEAAGGEGRLVLVAGEAGVGKTRLVAEVARQLHREGAVILFGRCEEELGIPYQPFVEALSEYIAAASADDLTGQLGPLGGELARLVPAVTARVAGLAAPVQADPETERYRLFEALREFLTALSETAPVVLVLDDLHWAARPTLALLMHLVRHPEGARLLIVGTYRDTDLGRTHPLADVLADLRRLGGTERMVLTGLDQAGLVAFAEGLTHHPVEGELLRLTEVVWGETEGNPFFVGEVLRHLVETRALTEVDGRWQVARPLTEVGLPESVREVVGRRLSHLPQSANDVLATAAVIGREFEVGVLAEAVDGGGKVALEAIEQAERAHLVVARPGRPGVYAFAHALVRATLYEELPTVARLRLHRSIGLAMERRVGAALAELAHHFVEAAPLGEAVRAVNYARQAGDRALDGLAFEEAASHYDRSLATLDLVAEPDPVLRCDLQIALGDALHHARDRRFRAVLADAADSARRLGDARRLAAVALAHNLGFARPVGRTDEALVALAEEALATLSPDDDTLRARLLAVLALELAWSPNPERRRQLVVEADAMARRVGDPQLLANVLSLQVWANTDADDLQSCRSAAAELVELAQELGDAHAMAMAYEYQVLCDYSIGDTTRAVGDLQLAQRYALQARNPVLQAELAGGTAINALLLGRFDEAEHGIQEARRLLREAGVPMRTVAAHFATQSFVLRYELGQPGAALEALEEFNSFLPEAGTAQWTWLAVTALAYVEFGDRASAHGILTDLMGLDPANWPRHVVWLGGVAVAGRVAASLEDSEAAAAIHPVLKPYAGRAGWVGAAVFGPVDPVLGLLAATLGRFEEADGHFGRAVELCRTRGMPTWLARSQCEWAEMLSRRGRPDDAERARSLAIEALEGARALGMAGVADRAEAMLRS